MTSADQLCAYVRIALLFGHLKTGITVEVRHDPTLHIPGVGVRDVVTIREREDLRGAV